MVSELKNYSRFKQKGKFGTKWGQKYRRTLNISNECWETLKTDANKLGINTSEYLERFTRGILPSQTDAYIPQQKEVIPQPKLDFQYTHHIRIIKIIYPNDGFNDSVTTIKDFKVMEFQPDQYISRATLDKWGDKFPIYGDFILSNGELFRVEGNIPWNGDEEIKAIKGTVTINPVSNEQELK